MLPECAGRRRARLLTAETYASHVSGWTAEGELQVNDRVGFSVPPGAGRYRDEVSRWTNACGWA